MCGFLHGTLHYCTLFPYFALSSYMVGWIPKEASTACALRDTAAGTALSRTETHTPLKDSRSSQVVSTLLPGTMALHYGTTAQLSGVMALLVPVAGCLVSRTFKSCALKAHFSFGLC